MIKNNDDLADRLKGLKVGGEEVSLEKFKELVTSEEEHEVEVSSGNIYTDEQIDSIKTGVKQQGYSEGKLAGSEMNIKEFKNEHNLEFEGKTLDAFYTHVKEATLKAAKIPEQQKVNELTESMGNLRKQFDTEKLEWDNKLTESNNRLNRIKNESFMIQSMPKIEGHKPNHMLASYQSDGFGLTTEEGQNVVTSNGTVLKDKYEKPVSFSEHFNSWLTDNDYMKTDGRGGGNNGGTHSSEFKNKNEAFSHMRKQNIDPTSSEGQKILEKVAQE